MFYQDLYSELGKLFFLIASVDGKVNRAERLSLNQLIQDTWKPMENFTDRYGTDLAYEIDYSFDYEESELPEEDIFESFKDFYQENKSKFTDEIKGRIMKTAQAIADAFHGKNEQERALLEKLTILLKN
ncbi:hypothetical protein [Daejeonella oryzae]|uniref:hypothetical protein n=1 Tax=Daejeonella oryzae TaxID=1122943 RepID=UPI000420A7C0|nr:hypothetical protein [Daejeonella oryzae]